MNKYIRKLIMDYRPSLNVPLRYVEKDEAYNSGGYEISPGYIVIDEKDENGKSITKYATVDVDEFMKLKEKNEMAIHLVNMKNIRTIRMCAVFLAMVTAIGIGIGIILGLVSATG